MLFTQLWQSVEVRLQALRRRWWPLDPVEEKRAEVKRLAAEIKDAEATLTELKELIEELRIRVADCERQATRLTAQVAECVKAGYESQAWPLALELAEVHRAEDEHRTEVRQYEQVCWSHAFHLRQLRRKLDTARGQLRRLWPPQLR